MSRSSSRRGGPREENGQDGWNTAPTVNRNAGNLTHFGKLSKSTNAPSSSNPFEALTKKGAVKGREAAPTLSRAGSNANMGNMFAALGGEAPAAEVAAPATSSSSRAPSRKPSLDLGPGGIPEAPQRRKLVLAPRTLPAADSEVPEVPEAEAEATGEAEAEAESSGPSMSAADAQTRIKEDVKEFWNGRNAEEAVHYFTSLPAEHRHLLVNSLVSSALEKKEADVILVADVFGKVADAKHVSEEAFGQGLLPTVESVDDLSVDIPKAYAFTARFLHGAKLSRPKVDDLATKIIVDGDPLTPPSQRLIKEYEKLSS